MATTTKLNIDKATVRQLFKVVARVADEIDESSFVHGSTKRRLALQPMANASEFYVPNMFKDRIMLNAKGYPDISGWSDIELANNKAGWEALGVVSSSLLSGTKFDHMGNEYLIPQTMAGIEIDCDSDEYQAWYTAFTRFPPAAIFEAQHQISDILNKHFEESIRSTHQKKSYYHATERWRDIKIALMNKLVKVKAYLRSQLSDELCKPITDHKSFIEVRESVELIVSMVEMAYGLSYKSEDHTTALQLIDAQLEKINSQANFAREQDRLEAIRVLHAARVQAGNGHKLDLELLLNQLGGIFKPEEVNPEDETLHAALSAQVRKPNHENRGAAVPDRSGPKKYDGEITLKSLYAELLKMTHTVNDMKSEMGSMRKAMLRSGMSFDHNPQKGKDQAAGNQKGKFAGTAKKKVRTDKVAQRSLVPVTQNHEVSDSDADATPEYGNVAIVNQPSKYVSPRAINAILARLTRQDIERVSRRIDVEEQVGRRLSLDEVEARIAADEGWTGEFLGEPEIQKSSVSGDATDPQDEASEAPITNSDIPDARASDDEGSASEGDGDGCAAAESDGDIVDETIRPSPMKNRTRSKSKKVIIPEPLMCSDTEDDEEDRPQPRKRNRAGPAQLRAGGHSKFFRRNSNQFPSIASKTLVQRKGTAGGRGRK